MSIIFNIFGSQSSNDWDIMVLVDKLPSTIDECHSEVFKNNAILEKIFSENGYAFKKINSNLCVVKDGFVNQVFKGTHEEVNNSIIDTYHLHKQLYPILVEKRVDRNIDLKLLRCFRILLSFLSRGPYRASVKKALSGNLLQKIEVLKNINYSLPIDLGNRNVELDNFYKILAFQLGQTLSLLDGVETYTKESINDYFSNNLLNALYRRELTNVDLEYLDRLKSKLIEITERDKSYLLSLSENSF